jgi:hypothetical protein
MCPSADRRTSDSRRHFCLPNRDATQIVSGAIVRCFYCFTPQGSAKKLNCEQRLTEAVRPDYVACVFYIKKTRKGRKTQMTQSEKSRASITGNLG